MREQIWKVAGPKDVSSKTWALIEVSDSLALDSLFGSCTTFEEMDIVAEDFEDESEGRLWYAVQKDSTDDWGTGSYSKEEAIKMMMEDDEYTQIAVIQNETCIEEIYKEDI